ncbi:ATP-binding protein [Terasakiella pusilla]|uniref:ATP-binding protein n=1 Tax=Terasakiella pusilla TaxID=64973 RepID=UPI003AA7E67C
MSGHSQITVCIDAHTKTNILLRAAQSSAEEQELPWSVLYVETPNHYRANKEERARILRFLTHAEALGAVIYHIEDTDVIKGIHRFVQDSFQTETPVTHLIVGESSREGVFDQFRTSLARKLVRQLRNLPTQIQVIPLASQGYKSGWFDRLPRPDFSLYKIAFALFSVLLAYGASELLRSNIPQIEWKINSHNIAAFFLLATVISALRYGMIAGLVSGIAGFSTINYFYTKPFEKFALLHTGDSLNLTIFLGASLFISFLGGYNRASHLSLVKKEKRSQALYKIHRLASAATERNEALKILHEELTELLEMEVAFFMPPAVNPNAIELVYPQQVDFNDADRNSLETCWDQVRTTGLGTLFSRKTNWRFEPLLVPSGEIGVIGLKVPANIRLDASFGRLLTALADQAASILERLELAHMMSESQMREEREKLRAMLLSSVSHDLKTPLASIIGSLSVYKRMRKSDRLVPEIADELTDTALSEAQRLDSFISNILDMTRIESGDITFQAEWIDPMEPLKSVAKRLKNRLSEHDLQIIRPDHDVEIEIDLMMTEQVLQNILDNAAKYSPTGTVIKAICRAENKGFSYIIQDQGSGIPEENRQSVFDKYERLKQTDTKVAGTGLGLAIAKAIIEKQNGEIHLRNHEAGGAEFTLFFPNVRTKKEEKIK